MKALFQPTTVNLDGLRPKDVDGCGRQQLLLLLFLLPVKHTTIHVHDFCYVPYNMADDTAGAWYVWKYVNELGNAKKCILRNSDGWNWDYVPKTDAKGGSRTFSVVVGGRTYATSCKTARTHLGLGVKR